MIYMFFVKLSAEKAKSVSFSNVTTVSWKGASGKRENKNLIKKK
ncbi:MAG: hypothetical protein ACREBI_08020 [Nitrosotalea sp.]